MTVGWSDPGYAAIDRLVRERAGLLFAPSRQEHAESSMRRAMRKARVQGSAEYAALLYRDEAALDELLAELTVGETYFFREPAHFTYIRDVFLPWLRERYGRDHTVRAWSAGCATGEEAYSLAITLHAGHMAAQVIGTDVSRTRLALARRGLYRQWSLRGVGDEVTRDHFVRRGSEYLLGPTARAGVEFRYLNLARDVYPTISAGIWGMDLILCRNVLIYLDAPTIVRVAERLMGTLADDGVLLLGASDPLLSEYVACDVVKTPAGVAYRRPGRAAGPEQRTAAPSRPWSEKPAPALDLAATGEAARQADPPGPMPSVTETATPSVPGQDRERLGEAYAARDYERVVALARSRVDGTAEEGTAVCLVRALANLGRLEEAGRECARALDVQRTSIELLYLHAVLTAQAGRLAEAVDAARRVLYLDRSFVVGHLALAAALARTGDRVAALRAYGSAERLLARMPPEHIVPASDGEPAGRLLQMARLQKRLLGRSAA